MPICIELLTLQLKQRVVQEKSSPLMIFAQVLNPLLLLKHAGFNTIPLSRVVNSEVGHRRLQKTHPSRLLVQESPHTIGNCHRIAHSSCPRIKSTIPWPRIDYSVTKQIIQHWLISGQLLPFWAKLLSSLLKVTKAWCHRMSSKVHPAAKKNKPSAR